MVASGADRARVPADFSAAAASADWPGLPHVVYFSTRGLDLILYIDALV